MICTQQAQKFYPTVPNISNCHSHQKLSDLAKVKTSYDFQKFWSLFFFLHQITKGNSNTNSKKLSIPKYPSNKPSNFSTVPTRKSCSSIPTRKTGKICSRIPTRPPNTSTTVTSPPPVKSVNSNSGTNNNNNNVSNGVKKIQSPNTTTSSATTSGNVNKSNNKSKYIYFLYMFFTWWVRFKVEVGFWSERSIM